LLSRLGPYSSHFLPQELQRQGAVMIGLPVKYGNLTRCQPPHDLATSISGRILTSYGKMEDSLSLLAVPPIITIFLGCTLIGSNVAARIIAIMALTHQGTAAFTLLSYCCKPQWGAVTSLTA